MTSTSAAPGDLDATFSGDGKLTGSFPRRYVVINDIALQRNGKIVVAGVVGIRTLASSPFLTRTVFALARYNPDGTLDRSFGGDGKVSTGFARRNASALGVAIQADGKIVAAGSAGKGSFALARYKPNGKLDSGFGGDGKVRTEFTPWFDFASDLVIQADGKIVAGGRAGKSGGRFALARYRPNGRLDPTFSRDGKAVADFMVGHCDDYARRLALQDDGKIVAAGTACGPHYHGTFALARYRRDGKLDVTFGGGGKVITDIAVDGNDAIAGLALQPDGKLVAAGFSEYEGPVLARYESDGALDPTFDGDGIATGGVARGDVVIQGDGRIVSAGRPLSGFPGTWTFVLTRHNPDGTPDTSFGGDGIVTTDFPGSSGEEASAVALQADGKIVAAGTVYPSSCSCSRLGVARYFAE